MIELNDSARNPAAGVRRVQGRPRRDRRARRTALDVGYRHIDTAEMYQNEAGVAKAFATPASTAATCSSPASSTTVFTAGRRATCLRRHAVGAGFDYVDLFLIHWPLPMLYDGDFVSTWKTLEEFAGRPGPQHRRVQLPGRPPGAVGRGVRHRPAVNQIEAHPYFANDEVRAYGQEHGIATEAWSPIAQGKVLDDAVVGHRRRDGQDARAGGAALAHSARRHRVPEVGDTRHDQGELRAFDFELSPDDVDAISALDRGEARPQRTQPRQVRLHPRLTAEV